MKIIVFIATMFMTSVAFAQDTTNSEVTLSELAPAPTIENVKTKSMVGTSIGAAIGASTLLYLTGGTAAPLLIAGQVGLYLPTTLYSTITATAGAISGGYIGFWISDYW